MRDALYSDDRADETPISDMSDAEFDAAYGGRELLPIEQVIYEAEGAERFARFHLHGRTFPQQVENYVEESTNG
jgi:hypothetical protein